MKNLVLKNNRFVKIICGLILCAGVAVFVSTCAKDDECKTCTNSETGNVRTYCGDELKDAEALPNVTCK
jgi:hypothetical protein